MSSQEDHTIDNAENLGSLEQRRTRLRVVVSVSTDREKMAAVGMILFWLAMLGVGAGVIALLIYAALRIIQRRNSEPIRSASLISPKPLADKEESRRIRVQIRHVLLDVWDPIGIKDEPDAQDEYDGYIGHLYELLVANATDTELSNYLHRIAHDRMGFEESKASDTRATVAALRTIPIE